MFSATRIMMTTLVCTLAACATLPASSAETPATPRPLSVRFVYLVSADRDIREDFRAAIAAAATHVQAFYAGQLGGDTFFLNDPIVEIARSDKPATWFYAHDTGSHKDNWGYDNALAETARLLGAGHFQNHIWVIYSDGPGNRGRGGSGVTVMPEDDLLGLVGEHPTQKDPRRWVYGMAHELGHALGLNHPSDNAPVPHAVMGAGFYTCFPDRCELTPEDIAILKTSIFIGTSRPSTIFQYRNGHFIRRDFQGRIRWTETTRAEKYIFTFDELESDPDTWLLFDPSRGFTIKIPRAGGQSHISADQGKTWRALYAVNRLD